ncbi:hypothetical protein KBD61_04240 [Patescibacteria group bacterium]|nr:hypothetical protein [Patescibacteria group bacterium]MBP9710204.1 hypothetical protein [Patescibacteria group bacterium]
MPTFSGEAVLLFYILCSVLGAATVFALFKPWRFGEYAKPVFLTVFSIVYFLASVAVPAFSPQKFQEVSDNAVHGFTALILILPVALYVAWSRRDTDHQTTWPRLEKVLSIIGGICLLVAAFFFILTMIMGQIEKVETLTIAPLPKILLTLVGIMLLAPLFLGLASMFVPKEAFHQLFTGGKIKGSWIIGYLFVCIILLGLVVVTSFL